MNIQKNKQTHTNKKDEKTVQQLLKKQKEECFNILNELKTHSKKTSHWAWYIFPTNKPGNADPLQTYVTIDTAEILLQFAPNEWQLCLEKIIELAIDKNNKLNEVLFDIDIDRVKYFIKFWKNIPNKPKWLVTVCDDLEKLLKPNTKYLVLLIQKHFNKLNNLFILFDNKLFFLRINQIYYFIFLINIIPM
jgi:hypothetical protein